MYKTLKFAEVWLIRATPQPVEPLGANFPSCSNWWSLHNTLIYIAIEKMNKGISEF